MVSTKPCSGAKSDADERFDRERANARPGNTFSTSTLAPSRNENTMPRRW